MKTDNYFEIVPYNHPEFPIYIEKASMSSLSVLRSHENWHNDIEFAKVLKGETIYNVNGREILVRKGEGIFINSNQIHYNFSKGDEECVLICVIFQPLTLCGDKNIAQKYVSPILKNPDLPYYVLKCENKWERDIIDNIEKIYDFQKDNHFELKFRSLFFDIWYSLYNHMDGIKKAPSLKKGDIEALKKMISFIHLNYREKIPLSSLAESANICKTGVNTLFHKYTGRSPIEYLNYFRLTKSIDLMKNTDMTLTQICYETGFSGASYFAETFKKVFGISPGEYRKLQTGR